MPTSTYARILIAEDDDADLDLITRAFKKSRLINEVHVVRDGAEAMDFLHRRGKHSEAPSVDIMLLDINMPKKNGQEVLAEIRQDPKLKRLPVVMLTSSSAEEDVLRAYETGANSYIRKPVGFDELKTIVGTFEDYWFAIVRRPARL